MTAQPMVRKADELTHQVKSRLAARSVALFPQLAG
jgi:hypothetical protein